MHSTISLLSLFGVPSFCHWVPKPEPEARHKMTSLMDQLRPRLKPIPATVIQPLFVTSSHPRWPAVISDSSVAEIPLNLTRIWNSNFESVGSWFVDVETPLSVRHKRFAYELRACIEVPVLKLSRSQLLMIRTKFQIASLDYAIIHTTMLVRLRPVTIQPYSTLQLIPRYEPDISHIHVFGCAVYVSIAPSIPTKMCPKRMMWIYVSYDSPSIVLYLESLTDDLCLVANFE